MDRLGRILPRVLAAQPGADQMRSAALRLRFARLFPQLDSMCDQVDLVRGTLVIVTPDAALAHQLRIDEQKVLDRLNEGSTTGKVRRLRIQIGRSNQR